MNVKSKKSFCLSLIVAGTSLSFFSTSFAQTTDSLRLNEVENRINSVKLTNNFKLSGYFQGQFQWGENAAALKIGAPNNDPEKSFNRLGVRRGRLKLTMEKSIAAAVFQVDLTEKGLGIKDAYLQIKDGNKTASSLKVGLFNRPFGYEIERSSSVRESPERSLMVNNLFPEERDLGVMLTLQAQQESKWHFIKWDVALMAGNGIKQDIKNRKDFISHLSFKAINREKITTNAGLSYYRGGVYQSTPNIYKMVNQSFILNSDSANIGSYSKREYWGADLQIIWKNKWGSTSIQSEWISGMQPGEQNSTKSPNASSISGSDLYLRNFMGAYISLVQNWKASPLATVIKLDWYDPNQKISKNEIGMNGSGKADLAYTALGAGLLWNINKNLKATAYYEKVWNEKTTILPNYSKDIKDDVLTIRLQYKF